MRNVCGVSLLTVLLCVSLGSADLVKARPRESQVSIAPYAIRVFTDTFQGNEDATVLVVGGGRTCMGLYVFDGAGNCLAKDDLTQPITADDLIVRWIPAEATRCSVEVRNAGSTGGAFGMDENRFQIALR